MYIYIYAWVLIGLEIICSMAVHGKEREGSHDFRVTFVGLLLTLPVYGRVFGWW